MKAIFKKPIFNNKRKVTIYSLFAVSIFAFLLLFLVPLFLHMALPTFGLFLAYTGVMFFGCLAAQLRRDTLW
ncbi:MAG: hypothetical protein NVSMB38_44140 [Ktedonobacteraceae bacterium]